MYRPTEGSIWSTASICQGSRSASGGRGRGAFRTSSVRADRTRDRWVGDLGGWTTRRPSDRRSSGRGQPRSCASTRRWTGHPLGRSFVRGLGAVRRPVAKAGTGPRHDARRRHCSSSWMSRPPAWMPITEARLFEQLPRRRAEPAPLRVPSPFWFHIASPPCGWPTSIVVLEDGQVVESGTHAGAHTVGRSVFPVV